MTLKKPDRWERIVDKVLERDGTIYHHEVTDLLRKEHAWVRRMVMKLSSNYRDSDSESPACYLAQDILDQLKRREK